MLLNANALGERLDSSVIPIVVDQCVTHAPATVETTAAGVMLATTSDERGHHGSSHRCDVHSRRAVTAGNQTG